MTTDERIIVKQSSFKGAYRCRACLTIFDTIYFVCPACATKNSLVPDADAKPPGVKIKGFRCVMPKRKMNAALPPPPSMSHDERPQFAGSTSTSIALAPSTFGEQDGEEEEEFFDPTFKPFLTLNEVPEETTAKVTSGYPNFDITLGDNRMGAGIPLGGTALIAGDSGLGKSTLLTQIAFNFASRGEKVVYNCGEEAYAQVKERVIRLGYTDSRAFSNFILVRSNNSVDVSDTIEKLNPRLVIVDSISVMYDPQFDEPPGSTKQMKVISQRITEHAHGKGYGALLICHVTKGNDIAGPKAVQHHVDIVINATEHRDKNPKIVKFDAPKTRFGRNHMESFFVMDDDTGHMTPSNPSGEIIHYDLPPPSIEPDIATDQGPIEDRRERMKRLAIERRQSLRRREPDQ
jgi:hypothetical protein